MATQHGRLLSTDGITRPSFESPLTFQDPILCITMIELAKFDIRLRDQLLLGMGNGDSKIQHNYTIKDAVPLSHANPHLCLWTLWDAVHKVTGEKVSIFYCQLDNKLVDRTILISSLQRLKTIRHPGIIRYKEAQFGDKFGENSLFLVTEPVFPLRRILKALPQEEVAIGLHGLLKTIKFLHSQHLCHNKIELDSIFVGEGRTGRKWLLGGMEFVTPFKDLNPIYIAIIHPLLSPDIVPPEDAAPQPTDNIPSPVHPIIPEARDGFSLGVLLTEILTPFLNETSPLLPWRDLQDLADAMQSMNPTRRPSLDAVLQNACFKEGFVVAVEFLNDIRALEEQEKRKGFIDLVEIVRGLPNATVNAYVLPRILNRELFLEQGVDVFLAECFGRNGSGEQGLVAGEAHKQYILPFIVEILAGFEEESEDIYILTFKAVCAFLPHLIPLETDGRPSSPTRDDDAAAKRAVSPRSSIDKRIPSDVRQQTPNLSGLTMPVGAVPASNNFAGRPEWSITSAFILEKNVMPKVLRCCIWDDVSDAGRAIVFQSVMTMWKALCEIEGRAKTQEILQRARPLIKSSIQCFHLVLKILPLPKKIEFLNDVLAGEGDREAIYWLPRILELLIPFMKDENKEFRNLVSDVMTRSISHIMSTLNSLPTYDPTADDDEEANVSAPNPYTVRLQRIYGRLPRRAVFSHSGPKPASHPSSSPSHEHAATTPTSKSASPSRAALDGRVHEWGEKWESGAEGSVKPLMDDGAGAGEDAGETQEENQRRLEAARLRREARAAEIKSRREAKKPTQAAESHPAVLGGDEVPREGDTKAPAPEPDYFSDMAPKIQKRTEGPTFVAAAGSTSHGEQYTPRSVVAMLPFNGDLTEGGKNAKEAETDGWGSDELLLEGE
ncbi:Protein-associating with the carboxyl-terminal domain of ezrin [Irineochytrium annulatum]|nr:Protein-associating with the carboxyl-terminal domain of ezrin [Irineochytrium annulatum]